MNLLKQETRPEESYRLIPLTQGQFAIVDAADFDWLNQWKWCAMWCPKMNSFYALRRVKNIAILMHRLILGLEYGDPREGDHIESGKTLDNRRNNLRIATRSQNKCNKRLQRNNTSGYNGVDFQRGKWRARVKKHGKEIIVGYYPTAEDAHLARCEAAKVLHGEFATSR